MASVMMELTEEARAHMFGPWNPYFHVTKVLIDTMDRVSITGLDWRAVTKLIFVLLSTAYACRETHIFTIFHKSSGLPFSRAFEPSISASKVH